MDHPALTGRLLLAAVVLSALLGGVAGGLVTTLVVPDDADRPVADAVAALNEEGGQADRVAAVAAAVVPSVVRVDVRGLGTGESFGNASGVVFDEAGHVVTNHHVVAGATGISVTFADGRAAQAVLVGSDPRSDLAVVRVDVDDVMPITLADSAQLQVGQLAVAVGSPFGLNGSVTAGIISALDRPVDLRGSDGSTVRLPGVIQTDAGISPGNSGGPLVDARGRMIGVNSAILSESFGSGVGFAVPSSIVASVVADLIADGAVATPYLGMSGTTLTPAAAGRLGVAGGALVEEAAPGGPADGAGIVAGDAITAVDGAGVMVMDDLVAAVQAAGVGATIVLDIVRDGVASQVSVTLIDAADHPGTAAPTEQ
ncbi:MAG TPA: trypsin-like peptidase domain-containing protein [Euzebya sp.]|nr:trypsin-like peptidase domain-containing protein [Euzebya sp.]